MIDWQSGVRSAASKISALEGCDLTRLVRDRESFERELQRAEYRPYGEILSDSLISAAREQGREVPAAQARQFAVGMSEWPPFRESRTVLNRLAERYQLAILSNVETRVLEDSLRVLEAPFEDWISAEDVGAYKPAPAHFETALVRLGIEKDRVLHVACSLYHDVRPALALGWPVAWVNREKEKLPADLEPSLVVPDLSTLARELGC